MHVLLFDIDGTLIHTRGSGLQALKLAFSEVFSRPAPAEIAAAGRTDRGIARDLFRNHALEDTGDNWLAFHGAYLRHLAAQLPLRDGLVLPGVVDFLERLADCEQVAVGLLTGNTQEGAQLKLEYFRLAHHFAFGAFGGHHPERNGVAREALAAAEGHLQRSISPDRVWVIGDTPLDIACARHIGSQAVAVATGPHERHELAGCLPDLMLDDLRQSEILWERLNLDVATSAVR